MEESGGNDGIDYRQIAPLLGRLWSPLAAVTSRGLGRGNVQIAVAIAAASIVPERPRVVVQIYKANYSHRLIYESRAFALNFLRPEQWPLIRDFGFVSGAERDKLAGIAYTEQFTGSPILADCAGWLDCRVVNAMDGGDMTVFLAEVVAGAAPSDTELLTWREARRRIPAAWNREWEGKIGGDIALSRQRMGQVDYAPWRP